MYAIRSYYAIGALAALLPALRAAGQDPVEGLVDD